MASNSIRIGNAKGFWGDSLGAAAKLVAGQSNIDYLTMDYLAEVSMSILAKQKQKDLKKGFAEDFIQEVRSLIPFWKKGLKFKVIVNAGGLNPLGCGKAVLSVLKEAGLSSFKIGVVYGDDVLDAMKKEGDFNHLDTEESVKIIRESLVSANAYLGAKPIVEALKKGADIVVTGRVADPSLTVAAAFFHFQWKWEDYNKLASATVAGHLIECGTQVTGGISTNWIDIPEPENIGYPIVEMQEDGSFVVTKPENTGGIVSEETVKEQLLYEISDPDNYISPDVAVSFLNLKLEKVGENRIKVTGAKGRLPTPFYKVSATYRNGFMAEGMLTLFSPKVHQRAHVLGEIVLKRVRNSGYDLERSHVECLGTGDVLPGVVQKIPDGSLNEGVLRICVADPRKEAVERFSKELAPLITSGAQGITGYAAGRPKVRPVFGFWPCLIEKKLVEPKICILEV